MTERSDEPQATEVTLYPDTLEALEVALEACSLVADGETVEAGDRDRFVRAKTDLRVLRRELGRGRDGR